MFSLKIEGSGHADIMPDTIVAFEDVEKSVVEGRPNAKATIYYNIGEGIASHIVENSYDVVKGTTDNVAKGKFIELNLVSGEDSRRMSFPRNNIIYREDLKVPEDAEGTQPATLLKVKFDQQIVTLLTVETREEIDLL